MNTKPARHALGGLLAAALLATALPGAAGPGHDLKPRHGGVMQYVAGIDMELVAREGRLALHLEDHGKPVATGGGSGKATLLLGSDRSEVALVPAGDGLMQSRDPVKAAPGTKVLATLELPGRKPVAARFVVK